MSPSGQQLLSDSGSRDCVVVVHAVDAQLPDNVKYLLTGVAVPFVMLDGDLKLHHLENPLMDVVDEVVEKLGPCWQWFLLNQKMSDMPCVERVVGGSLVCKKFVKCSV